MKHSTVPNFIIAGVNKAATTSVFQYLSHHPEICCSLDKETNYFLPIKYNSQPLPIKTYLHQFKNYKNQKYILEASPLYFYGGMPLAETIKNTVDKDCKILIILREPVSRTISFFNAKKKALELNKEMSLDNYIQICMSMPENEILLEKNNMFTGIIYSCYSNYIKTWFDIFNSNVKVLFYEDLNASPLIFMKNICEWLQIDSSYFDNYAFEIENKTFIYKNRTMQQFAIDFNYKASRFFRKNPKLKKWLRNQYLKINKADHPEIATKESLLFLSDFYHPFNLKLKQFLVEKGMTNMPPWLNP